MLRNEFDLEFILESVKKTIMGFFFGCFRVKDENQNHHIISVSSNKKNPLASRNRLAVLHLSESQGVGCSCNNGGGLVVCPNFVMKKLKCLGSSELCLR